MHVSHVCICATTRLLRGMQHIAAIIFALFSYLFLSTKSMCVRADCILLFCVLWMTATAAAALKLTFFLSFIQYATFAAACGFRRHYLSMLGDSRSFCFRSLFSLYAFHCRDCRKWICPHRLFAPTEEKKDQYVVTQFECGWICAATEQNLLYSGIFPRIPKSIYVIEVVCQWNWRINAQLKQLEMACELIKSKLTDGWHCLHFAHCLPSPEIVPFHMHWQILLLSQFINFI